jgi:hypothetical protein
MVSVSWVGNNPVAVSSKSKFLLVMKDFLYPRGAGYLREVHRLMPQRWECEVTLDEGVPGCGKTTFIKQNVNLDQDLILTPGKICQEFVSSAWLSGSDY